jgi:hypothetical protein
VAKVHNCTGEPTKEEEEEYVCALLKLSLMIVFIHFSPTISTQLRSVQNKVLKKIFEPQDKFIAEFRKLRSKGLVIYTGHLVLSPLSDGRNKECI